MNKKPTSPLTFVRRFESDDGATNDLTKLVGDSLRKQSVELASKFDKLSPSLKASLANSVTTFKVKRSGKKPSLQTQVSSSASVLVGDIVRSDSPKKTIGILDLGAWLSGLPKLSKVLSDAQTLFTFVEIQAPVPAGLLKQSSVIEKWASEKASKPLSKAQKESLTGNVIADEFFRVSDDFRESMRVDYIVGVCSARIADITDGEPEWNLFSTASQDGHSLLVSVADLREFASKAKRPFEAVLGANIVAQLLAMIDEDTGYHDDIGCIFDYNEKRESIVSSMKTISICDECRKAMKSTLRDAAVAMANALKKMKV
jgi:hypothetical protein